jgi:uncharacterized membrane protein YdjX (TVP38/TMEM64 family)
MTDEAKSNVTRFLPLIAVGCVMALVFAMGWHKYLSFKTLGLNYQSLKGFIGENLLLSLLIYMALYVVAVALSLPGGLVLTLSGGLLFGWALGAPAAIIAATIGATLIFLIVRTSLGEGLAQKAGPWVVKLSDGFKENALSYLLFLRLVPAFPFFIVNIVPALLSVPLATYVVGTGLGIIPATTAFSVLGAGLGSAIEAQNAAYAACQAKAGTADDDTCPYTIDTSSLVTPEIIAAFVLLGIVALIPVAYKKWSSSHATS